MNSPFRGGWSRGAAAAVLLLVAAGHAWAVDPQINSLSPAGLQRGSQATLTIRGTGLANVQEILFYSPGFTVQKLEAPKDDTLVATLEVSPQAELGIHALRLRSRTGVSNLRVFTVGPFPAVAEVEPNSRPDQAQQVPLNVTVEGVVQAEDVDWFVVALKQGQRLNVEVEGLRIGTTFFDPFVAIHDEQGRELARSDDTPLLAQDCLCSLVAPQDGTYRIQLRDVAYGGSSAAVYRMHVGTFPRPTAVFPPGGRPGEKLTLHWIGDVAGEFAQEVTLPSDGRSEVAIVPRDGAQEAPSPNMLRVSDLAATTEVEPNNDPKSATSGSAAPLALHGVIAAPGDVDFFAFTARKGQQLDVRVYARKPLRSPLDAVLSIHNAQGGTLASNDDSGGPDSYVRFNVPADGTFLVSVTDQLARGGADYVYRVEVTEVTPSLVIRLPERRQYVSTTLVIPQNNRNALMVAAQRQNFSGELALHFEGLPAGVTATVIPMPAGMQEVPVLFSAAADAPPAGALVGIVGRTTDPKLNVVGRLDQRTMLVRGQNNVDVWGHNADRMATVVAEPIPYSLEIVPPKAPLVRGGSLPLKVVAHRAEGFKDPIALRMLYNPPGISSSGFVTIPPEQSEAVIPLTASGGAALGTWKVCVTGRSGAPSRGGSDEALRCSTQLADLTVAEPLHKLALSKVAVEQGREVEFRVKVEKLRDFEGTATAELAGLPANTSSSPVEFTKDTSELVFKVSAAANARPGRYTSVVCVTRVPWEGEVVTYTQGGGELRVDAPLPAKASDKPAAKSEKSAAKK
jgi:hypothetical protein